MKFRNLRNVLTISLYATVSMTSSAHAAQDDFTTKLYNIHWKQTSGKGDPMCDALDRELKRYKNWRGDLFPTSCVEELILPHSREFTAPPWQKLDARYHRQILRKIWPPGQISQLAGQLPVVSKKPLTFRQVVETERDIDDFIARGGYLEIWRSPLPAWMQEKVFQKNMPASPLIYMRTAAPMSKNFKKYYIDKSCKGVNIKPSKMVYDGVFLVNEQLDDFDPRIMLKTSQPYFTSMAIALSDTLWTDIFLYKNIPYFFNLYTTLDVFSIQSYELLFEENHCSFEQKF